MSDLKATPGPWVVVARPAGTGFRHYIHAGRRALASTYSFESSSPTMKAMVLANANLIAAAPELYEALGGLLAEVEKTERRNCKAVGNSRAALAKARGEQ